MSRRGQGRGRSGAKGVRSGANLAPAATRAEFAADPHGRWIGGRGFVYAWPTEALCLTALFDRPGPDDLSALMDLFALELAEPARPHASLIDATRLDRVDAGAFEALAAYVERTRERMTRWVTRLAIVRPSGFVGALAAGFYEAIDPPYPVEVFDERASAFEWVGAEAALDEWLARTVAAQRGAPEPLRAVRRVLDARLPEVDVEGCAQALGTSVRTLQRKLKRCGTTFRRELSRAQVEAAKRWLSSTDEPISRIAYEVGFSTPQHLSAAFRAATGSTPSAWRDGHRAR